MESFANVSSTTFAQLILAMKFVTEFEIVKAEFTKTGT